jgi:hypothetical protein
MRSRRTWRFAEDQATRCGTERQLSDQPADDGIPGGQKLDRAYAIMTSQNLVVGCSTRPGRRGKPRTSIRIEANDALLDVSHRAIPLSDQAASRVGNGKLASAWITSPVKIGNGGASLTPSAAITTTTLRWVAEFGASQPSSSRAPPRKIVSSAVVKPCRAVNNGRPNCENIDWLSSR